MSQMPDRLRDGLAKPVVLETNRETAGWGLFTPNPEAVLTVKSGACVTINTLSWVGATAPEGPVAYFEALGVPAGQLLPELMEMAEVPRPNGSSGHILTGPIGVEGAEPGDVLQIRILDVSPRVPYGVNSTGPGSGVLDDLLDRRTFRLFQLDPDRRFYPFVGGIEIPFRPFAGVMAVAPPPSVGAVSANPPDRWGGNMDFRDLVAGSTLYLPVFQPGGMFYTSDTHGAQGHGEVNQTAIEHSMAVTVQLIVHKGGVLTFPRAENDDHVWFMGIHADLYKAMKIANQEVVDYLVNVMAMRDVEAYRFSSLVVDFKVAEAVNGNKVVVAEVHKDRLRPLTDGAGVPVVGGGLHSPA
ncbi:acetamidase/formamidase family protein [Spirillospora sp. CA-128828]|uniref:acetamidase/formamidase family protein n=1 Tax=Spirillospora sp. CA-128828 TaxID=3240033 RepID=UPI003D8F4C8A